MSSSGASLTQAAEDMAKEDIAIDLLPSKEDIANAVVNKMQGKKMSQEDVDRTASPRPPRSTSRRSSPRNATRRSAQSRGPGARAAQVAQRLAKSGAWRRGDMAWRRGGVATRRLKCAAPGRRGDVATGTGGVARGDLAWRRGDVAVSQRREASGDLTTWRCRKSGGVAQCGWRHVPPRDASSSPAVEPPGAPKARSIQAPGA